MKEQPGFWEQSDLLALVDAKAADAKPVDGELSGSARGGPERPAAAIPGAAPAAAAAVALPSFTPAPQRPPRLVPERVLLLDTETTALSPQTGQCIEVGAILFHVPSRSVLQQVSFLLPCTSNPAESVNGIPAALTRLEQPWRQALACFEAMVAASDVLVAHNAAFDRQWFGHGELPALTRPWICTMEDVPWPADRHLRATPSVRDLALAYGIPVWACHRALTDSIYLAEVFARCDDLEQLLVAALEPRTLYRACLSYGERHLAKEAGFRWNDPVRGAWTRRLTQAQAEALVFAVQPVECEPAGEGETLPRTA